MLPAALLRASTDGQGTQVVSVVRPALQPHLGPGTLSEALFFRLNILPIEINCRQPESMPSLALVG